MVILFKCELKGDECFKDWDTKSQVKKNFFERKLRNKSLQKLKFQKTANSKQNEEQMRQLKMWKIICLQRRACRWRSQKSIQSRRRLKEKLMMMTMVTNQPFN